MSNDQAHARAHLRTLPRCACGKAATVQLFNGVNAAMDVYCEPHGKQALKRLKETPQ